MLIEPHILISSGTHKAKCYPYWDELAYILTNKGYHITQLGIGDQKRICAGIGNPNIDYVWDKPLKEVEDVVRQVGDFVAIDNFLHHLAHQLGVRGAVIYGPSDPRLFGYSDQINIIKKYEYLRKDQLGFYRDYVWEHDKEGWYGAEEVYKIISNTVSRESSGSKGENCSSSV